MQDDIITMADMEAVFQVTDTYGIHRERVSVPLEKADPGDVRRLPTGEVEIVVPASVPVARWQQELRRRLEEMGFQPVEEQEE